MQLDIIFAIFILSRYISNPSLEHFQTLKKLYRYLLGTRLILKYIKVLRARIISGILLDNDIYLDTYSDSNWGRDENNCYSMTNYFFKIAGGAIS